MSETGETELVTYKTSVPPEISQPGVPETSQPGRPEVKLPTEAELKKVMQKFGNDKEMESPFDSYETFGFSAQAELLVDPAYKMGLTPNYVTTLSKVFEGLAFLLILAGYKKLAAISYWFGYDLDCVDGRLARKYNMCSKVGMIYDFVSDMIAHTLIFLAIWCSNGCYFSQFVLIIISVYQGNVYYGLVQAMSSMKKKGHDNFYKTMKEDIIDKRDPEKDGPVWAGYAFLFFHLSSYDCYKILMPVYDEETARRYMRVLRWCGPGTFAFGIDTSLFFGVDQYILFTADDIFYFYGNIPTVIATFISVGIAYGTYRHSGKGGKYVADPIVHNAGILMGLIIMGASRMMLKQCVQQDIDFAIYNQLAFQSGVILFMFHLFYDIDHMFIRHVMNFIADIKKNPKVQKKML